MLVRPESRRVLRTPCKGVHPLAQNAQTRWFANMRTPQDSFWSTLLRRGHPCSLPGHAHVGWRIAC